MECRYNTCNGIIANARKYGSVTVEQSCAIAIDRNVFSSRKFEQILKTTEMLGKFNRSNTQTNPTPTDGENLRGKKQFA